MMPIRGLKFISKFLKPNLNSQRFGTRLKWLNEKYMIFQLQWNHKSASDWTKEDAEVFIEWDKLKGRFVPDDRERFTKSKQRFRAIMYKLIKAQKITEICSEKYTKIYCFGEKNNIPNEVIAEALNSRRNPLWEISNDKMYTSDPEAAINEMYARSFMTNDYNIIEDHKYANLKKEVTLEMEDIVPDTHLEELNSCDTQLMYLDIIQCSESEKQDCNSKLGIWQDSNDSAEINIQWEVSENQNVYDLKLEENPFHLDDLLL